MPAFGNRLAAIALNLVSLLGIGGVRLETTTVSQLRNLQQGADLDSRTGATCHTAVCHKRLVIFTLLNRVEVLLK